MEFQAISWHAEDVPDEDGDMQYVIKIFGRTADSKSVGVSVVGFKPFFYVKVPVEWESNACMTKIYKNLENVLGKDITIEFIKRKDFWGFTNDRMFHFFKLSFASLARMKQSITKLNKSHQISGLGRHKYDLYESNIEPFLKFIHIRGLLPTGWINITKYNKETDLLPSTCDIDIECQEKAVCPIENRTSQAPFIVASFDIECTSSGGEFPVPVKSYKHFSTQLYEIFTGLLDNEANEYVIKETLIHCIRYALGFEKDCNYMIAKVIPKKTIDERNIKCAIDNIFALLNNKGSTKVSKEKKIENLSNYLSNAPWLGPLEGDPVIQIGTTFHTYGSRDCFYKHIITLGDCSPIDGTDVESYDNEKDVLMAWKNLIHRMNPDIITGYNILGFDFSYIYERAKELGIEKRFMNLTRFVNSSSTFQTKKLSSSALGDNLLQFISMEGRVIVDLMKVVQRDHKLDSYKLDAVAQHFTGERKEDVTPKEIFALQKGTADDRKRIAVYCVQDCALCNKLVIKLEIITNNMGMSNVCLVPLEYIFMRGQGIKIFSLVLNECRKEKFLIPVLKRSVSIRKEILDEVLEVIPQDKHTTMQNEIKKIERALKDETCFEGQNYSNTVSSLLYAATNRIAPSSYADVQRLLKTKYPYHDTKTTKELEAIIAEVLEEGRAEDDSDSYEGAIVLPPKQGIYINNPVSVFDYASLYPSTMCAENLSHDKIVIDPSYDNLPGKEYTTITYDIYKPGTKEVIGQRVCRFVQNEQGIIPKILTKLLKARKSTRKKMTHVRFGEYVGLYSNGKLTTEDGNVIDVTDESELVPAYNEFEVAVLDGLQLAYKITANSLYGQIGAKTSQIYLKDIAACTTAGGRAMILYAKKFLEDNYGAEIVYGDTDSVFCIFPSIKETGKDAIMPSINIANQASEHIKPKLKAPHDLEYEKTFWPFILLSKKRYVGNLYEQDDKKFKQKSMGIVLKRRDNANIVKHLYGGVIDIILNQQNFEKSIDFLQDGLDKLIKGKFDLDQLVISKSLRADYKDPSKIAHKVLAERIAERDPGNKPQVNDRIPYVYIFNDNPNALQGERIEHPAYVQEKQLVPDYGFYITNQIMKPLLQLYALEVDKIPGFSAHPDGYLDRIYNNIKNELQKPELVQDKFDEIKEVLVKQLLFDPILKKIDNVKIKKSLLLKKYSK